MQQATPHPAFGHLPQRTGEGESAALEMCEFSRDRPLGCFPTFAAITQAAAAPDLHRQV